MKVVAVLPGVAAALVLAASAVSATQEGLPRLKPSYEPEKLTAGGYRTPEGFAPAGTFRVGVNWYGAGDSHEWSVGKGLNRVEQRYAVGGIYVETLKLSLAKVLLKFRALKSLVAGPATPARVGGYSGLMFHAKVKADHAPLAALGSTADIPGDLAGQQMFLNVRGKTLLIRTETQAGSRTATADMQRVLRTFRFVH